MSEIGDALLRAEVMAQGALLRALVDTHPDPALLRRAFEFHSEPIIASLLGSAVDDTSLRAQQYRFREWAEKIEAAEQRNMRPKSSAPPG